MPHSERRSDRYTRTAMVLHWSIALLVILQFGWGWWMQDISKQPPGPRVDAFNLHKSLGLTILAMMMARLAWRAGHAPPPLPAMPHWQRHAARVNHALLYAVLIALPVVGYLGSAWSGYPVRYFGVVLPVWTMRHEVLKEAMSTVHLVLSWLLAGAVALHVAAVVRHMRQDGTALLSRMGWPSRGDAPVASARAPRGR
ncbi:MAG: cytochrome b [Casimicrobiaceae bacterium]